MHTVNIFQAKTNLSKLVEEVESGREDAVIIARNGRPVARLTAIRAEPDRSRRIGVAAGLLTIPDDIDVDNALVAEFFMGKE